MDVNLAIKCSVAWEYIITEQCPWLLNDPDDLWLVEFLQMQETLKTQ